MKNSLRQILIAASPNFDVVILQQLEYIAQTNSVQIHLFDNTKFSSRNLFDSENQSDLNESDIPNKNCQFKNLEFNVCVGKQLTTALIHDNDLQVNKDCLESRDNRLTFHENINRNQILWYSLQQFLSENQIDSVVFLNNPQGLNEIVLYQVSVARKIDILILYQSPFSNRFFSYGSIPECGNYEKNVKISIEHLPSNDEISTKRKHRQNSCNESLLSSYFKILMFLLKVRSLNLLNPVYISRHAKHLHDAPANAALWKDPFANFFYCKSTAYFEFLTNPNAGNTYQSQKFVYFPLQSFSELHSEVVDNQFGDQLLALERLALLVPIDCKIFVKNDVNLESDYLTPMLFHRIKRILNVVRLPSCVDSEQLIDNSMFVATVRSEEGWKALSLGKRVLTFGKPWYRKLPGAIEYHKDIEYSEIMNVKISETEYIRHIKCLLSHAHIGSLFPMGKNDTIDSEKARNAKRVAETILQLVLGQEEPTFQTERVVL